MADNVGYTPGSGAIVAADDISGVLYQRIKPTFGENGVAIDISSANPLPVVTDRNDSLTAMIQRLTKILESNMVVDSSQRQRITIDSIAAGVALPTVTAVTTVTTVTTLTTLTTLTGQTNIGGYAATDQVPSLMRISTDSLRRNITVT
jgi:hypothetical protein